ncbi:hypothetical protein [Leptolyngbya sp. FACHB-711]|jgi:hypothetical protein|nr:hypothetical protein [Leptolyngbya sp. FACHB-711]MBD1849959.1 hypothetical protein [Cyanobacteria bacterium FACHB-502]MBD2024835.1 hypothetical protein [Leptolyngbya sp. FACHB-711]
MQTSRGERLFAAVLTFLTVGSVVTLTYFLLTSSATYSTIEINSQQLEN